jgi:hypothetical protein
MTRTFLVATLGAALLASGATSAAAQSKPNPDKPAAARSAAAPAAARKPPQPAAPAQRAVPSYDSEPGRVSDYWTIERALPSRSSAERARPEPAPQFGRARLQNQPGSVGLASGTIRSSEFADGRPVPGLTQNTQRESSYVGLSLSVPSNNNSFPIPLLSPGGSNGW